MVIQTFIVPSITEVSEQRGVSSCMQSSAVRRFSFWWPLVCACYTRTGGLASALPSRLLARAEIACQQLDEAFDTWKRQRPD